MKGEALSVARLTGGQTGQDTIKTDLYFSSSTETSSGSR